MRKIILFIVLCSAGIVLAGNSYKIRNEGFGDYHFGYISASGGLAPIYQDIPEAPAKGSWGFQVGAGYEFRMKNGWLSVGVDFMQEQSTVNPSIYVYNTPFGGEDNQVPAKKVDKYMYTISQSDKQVWRTIGIPLMAGYYNSGLYVGAGVKVGIPISSSITTSGTYSLSAQYNGMEGIMQSTDEFTHPIYHTYDAETIKYNCNLRPRVSLIAEIGYDVLSSIMSNSNTFHMLKIALYAECGLRSVRPEDSMDPIQLQGMNMTEAAKAGATVTPAQITPYYLSTQTAGKTMIPFYVGVKLTYCIGSSWSATSTWHKGGLFYRR